MLSWGSCRRVPPAHPATPQVPVVMWGGSWGTVGPDACSGGLRAALGWGCFQRAESPASLSLSRGLRRIPEKALLGLRERGTLPPASRPCPNTGISLSQVPVSGPCPTLPPQRPPQLLGLISRTRAPRASLGRGRFASAELPSAGGGILSSQSQRRSREMLFIEISIR